MSMEVCVEEASPPFECPPTLARIAVRMADEGIPVRAIARSVGWPAEDIRPVLREAIESGTISEYPREDWPVKTPRDLRLPTASHLNEDQITDGLRFLYKITPTESKVLSLLLRRTECSKQQLHDTISENQHASGDQTQIKIVDVIICHLRKKFRQSGVTMNIQTSWGRGYFVDRDEREAAIKRVTEWYATPGG